MIEQAAAGALFILLALGSAVACGMFLFEAWALLYARTPITWYARLGISDHPRVAFVAALALGTLFGHLFWR